MPHPALSERVHPSLGRSFEHRVNCFCVSEFFFRETAFRQTTADEMLDFVAQSFHQVSDGPSPILNLVWSRSSFQLPVGGIQVAELVKRPPGFPLGLILEHSFVRIDHEMVFQKADPTTASKIEVLPLSEALKPYTGLAGFEITRHQAR